MDYILEISKIIEGGLKHDTTKVINFCELLITKLEADNDFNSAKKIKKMINEKKDTMISPMGVKYNNIPVDTESRFELANIYTQFDSNSLSILSEHNMQLISEFIRNYKHSDKLHKLGLEVSNTLLLYGPPGCGKTKAAHMIAKELGIPLVVARLDGVVSSYLGTTSKNIRAIFDYVEKTPCVLFLDEFDAIAKSRDDDNELGELKRVVNSLLQNIDFISKSSVVIAATNHENLLDPAVWRRFNYKINVGLPSKETVLELIKYFSEGKIVYKDKELLQISSCMDKMSGSDIKELLEKAFRNDIVLGEEPSVKTIYEQIFKKFIFSDSSDISLKEKVKFLYDKNNDDKKFTYDDIAHILCVSKSHISNLLKIEEGLNE